MKKLISAALVLAMVLSFAGCNSSKKETLKVNDFGEAIGFPESAIFSKINSVQVEEKKLENTIIYVAVGVAVVILITIAIKKEIKNNFKVSE